MRVRHLALEEFRSYDRAEIVLAPGITAFVGANGAGKTNLLEAIHLAARGDSARARDDAEIVRWGAAVGRVRVEVERASEHERATALEEVEAGGCEPSASEEGDERVEVLLFAPAAGERRRPRRWLLDGAGGGRTTRSAR